ncbi:MAG: hypothetical protein GY874_14205 [Desulfobacteraceae bacterium]|nr:hypothetical protein [Desulfobacteraceae bacterium]
MKKLLTILFVHSVKDLFKHKSFFLLIFILIVADRGLKLLKKIYDIDLGLPFFFKLDLRVSGYVFEQLPNQVVAALTDYRVFAVLAGLFFFKQIISLWPSSDMRRMHRQERKGFGILTSLSAIRWEQLIWDAVAVSSLCLISAGWCLVWFGVNWYLWQKYPSMLWLYCLTVLICAILPIILAGFSYSSKLAVICQGKFAEKLSLYFKLFSDVPMICRSWLFFMARIVVEAIFVGAIPAYILLTVEGFALRIFLAAILATPVYSYLKMASFKFFLFAYKSYPIVRNEYANYYRMMAD